MSQQTLNNGDTLLVQRTKINNNAGDAISSGDTSDQTLASNLDLADDKLLGLNASSGSTTKLASVTSSNGLVGSIGCQGFGMKFFIERSDGDLSITSTTLASLFRMLNNGTVSFDQYGAGDTQFLSGGVLTSVSDSKYKTHTRDFEYGGEEINAISDMMGFYTHNESSPHSNDPNEYASFYADKVADIIPQAAPLNTRYVKDSEGNDTDEVGESWYSLNTRPIIMALVKAHKEQSNQIEALTARIEALES